MGDIELRVNGQAYSGWESVRVKRSLESISGSFDLTISERWAGRDRPWPIGAGDECVVTLHGEPVITGFLDGRSPEFDSRSSSVTVSGRDLAGDLVDSSCDLGTWEFRDLAPLALAQKIASQFGVTVSLQAGVDLGGPVNRFSVDPGATAFDALERLCRKLGVFPVADGRGGIVLARGGFGRAAVKLEQGKNLLAGSARYSFQERFRKYKLLGSHAGSDEVNGSAASSVKAEAEDVDVPRAGRVKILRGEGSTSTEQAQRRVKWEASVRAARSVAVSVQVQGWRQGERGPLWAVNQTVAVRSARLDVDGEMLVAGVEFSSNVREGVVTRLDLRRTGAFRPEPLEHDGGGDRYWKEIRRGALT